MGVTPFIKVFLKVVIKRKIFSVETILYSCSLTITIYFINPSGELKLSFDHTTKNISQ